MLSHYPTATRRCADSKARCQPAHVRRLQIPVSRTPSLASNPIDIPNRRQPWQCARVGHDIDATRPKHVCASCCPRQTVSLSPSPATAPLQAAPPATPAEGPISLLPWGRSYWAIARYRPSVAVKQPETLCGGAGTQGRAHHASAAWIVKLQTPFVIRDNQVNDHGAFLDRGLLYTVDEHRAASSGWRSVSASIMYSPKCTLRAARQRRTAALTLITAARMPKGSQPCALGDVRVGRLRMQ